MCNDYEQHVRRADYCNMMQALELRIPSRQSELYLPQADDIRINHARRGQRDRARAHDLQLSTGASCGAPVFNFRSEGRHFVKSNRCLIPASAFFEFTGKKYPKAEHRFALCSPIAGILERSAGQSSAVIHDADDSAGTGRGSVS
jgi:putative SOS response-associated peptidase YedK